jgi:peptide/nickel transport system substrate-binding protein
MRNATRWSGAAGALLALALAGCGGGDREQGGAVDSGGETPVQGGTAIIAESSDMEVPMPLFWTGNVDSDLVDVMYMALLRADWQGDHLEFVTADRSPMAMASRYEFTGPDSLAIRFHLRPGLKWSDGVPITAGDVAWTYRMATDPAVGSPRRPEVELLQSVDAENDSTVLVRYRRRHPDMLFSSSFSVAPRHAYEGTAPAELQRHPTLAQPAGKMVVSGSFMIGGWQPGSQITLVPNPHFPVRPHLDRIVIRVVPDLTTRLMELQTGKVDVVHGINAFEQVPRVRREAPFLRFVSEKGRFMEYLAWNPKTVPAFADRDVRYALSLAVDVDDIIRSLDMQDFVTRTGGPLAPIFGTLADPARFPPLRADPAKAREILAQKGWKDTNGDGIVEKDGQPFRFTLETSGSNPRRMDIAQLVQRQLRAVGVDVAIRPYEFNTFNARLQRKEYQAAIGSWGIQLTPDLLGWFAPGALFNVVSLDDPETTRLMEQAASQPTSAAANPIWQSAAERIMTAYPYTWMYFYDIVSGVNPRLKGVEVDSFGFYQNPWAWWIPEGLQAGPQTAVRH